MYKHWIDKIVLEIAKRCEELDKKECVINGGLSVSGLQHVGRLRGEVILNHVIAEKLRNEFGFKVKQYLTLYTVDPWKGKEKQLNQFENPKEARKYINWPLENVPDPYGCHNSWIEHYWEDFGNYLNEFASEIEIVKTGDLYRNSDKMREFIKLTIERRHRIIEILNKYRSRNPYPQDYIPFEPICKSCGKVGTSKVIEINVDKDYVIYKCECGYEGKNNLSEGKLPWRIEWVGVWYVLNVDFEPFGKDHATPGGSRDSANDLAINVYGIKPPYGIWYEWVGYVKNGRDVGDMGSSDFIGFTPREWLEVAEPEVLRYYYIFHEPQKRLVLGLENVYQYVDMYDRAEKIYYGIEQPSLSERQYLNLIIKSYEYAQLIKPIPKEPPFQIPYLHAVALIQTLPSTEDSNELFELVLKRLKMTKILTKDTLDDYSRRKLLNRLLKARNWVLKYAPEQYRIKVSECIDEKLVKNLKPEVINKIKQLINKLERLSIWSDENIKEAMKSIPKESKVIEKEFFKAIYIAFFNRDSGPRIAPYMTILGKEFTLNRLKELVKLWENISTHH